MFISDLFDIRVNGRIVYRYFFVDNKDDGGVIIGDYPEVEEKGQFLECFPKNWRHGKIAIDDWLKVERGVIRGKKICICGRHKAVFSVRKGLKELIERKIIIYEVSEE